MHTWLPSSNIHRLARGCLVGDLDRLGPGDEPVEFAEDHDHGLGQLVQHAGQGQLPGERVRLFQGGGPAVVGEGRDAVRGPVADERPVVIRPAGDDQRPDAGLERGGPGGEVAAQADPQHAGPAAVEVTPAAQHIESRGEWCLEVGADGAGVSRLALPGPVQGEGGHAPGQEDVLRGEELFLGRVQARDEQDQRRAVRARGPPQVAGHGDAVELDFQPFRGRVQQPVRAGHRGDRLVGCGTVAGLVQHPDELGEVIAERGADPGPAGRAPPAEVFRLAGQAGVHVTVRAPRVQPVSPVLQPAGHPGEVARIHALRREPRPPVGDG